MTRPAESMYNMRMARRLVKSKDRKLFGVAGGVAEYFDIDPTIVRVGFAVLCFVLSPLVLIGYGERTKHRTCFLGTCGLVDP